MNSVHERGLILVVEDNPDDAEILRMAIEEAEIDADLAFVADGIDALRYLRPDTPGPTHRRPSLVLLDLNLPGMHGHDVLESMKADPMLSTVPVIVMSTSVDDHDIDASYTRHANAYISKPTGFDEMITTMQAIRDFWFASAQLPRH